MTPHKLLALTAPVVLLSCNHAPVHNLEKSFTLKVEAGTGDSAAVKIDFLWVVDNSSSMCQEQRALSENFDKFVASLEESFDVDARVAVTSVDAQCQNDGLKVFSARGKFNTHVDRETRITCAESRFYPCKEDEECTDAAVLGSETTSGEWRCASENLDVCITNPNGSFNTSCMRRCQTDAECQNLFGDPRYRCIENSGAVGCVLPPDTADCPDELPPFLEKNATLDNTELFKCIAHVGVTQEKCLQFEQPMRTAFMALDPLGPNAAQAASFLRPDANLVIIIISDEEDCSVADGRDDRVSELQFFRCGLLPTTDTGGPLVPVAHFVNRFKALKSDPGKVIMATIAGDALGDDPEEERRAYLESKGGARDCYSGTYVCDSEVGTADYGARFVELAEAFGPNGTFQNICDARGLDAALVDIADTIVSVVNKLCLPKPILTSLTVTRTRRGEVTTLTEGATEDGYRLTLADEGCPGGGGFLPSLTFSDRPLPGDEINVTYEGDPELP